jgi:hypothetical protein
MRTLTANALRLGHRPYFPIHYRYGDRGGGDIVSVGQASGFD